MSGKTPATNITNAEAQALLNKYSDSLKNPVWEFTTYGERRGILDTHLGPKTECQDFDEQCRPNGSHTTYLTPYLIIEQLHENIAKDSRNVFRLQLMIENSYGSKYKTICSELDEYLEFTVKGLEMMVEVAERKLANLNIPEAPKEKVTAVSLSISPDATTSDIQAVLDKQKQESSQAAKKARLKKHTELAYDFTLIGFYTKSLNEVFWKALEETRAEGKPIRNISIGDKTTHTQVNSGIALLDSLRTKETKQPKDIYYDISDKVDQLLERITAAKAKLSTIEKTARERSEESKKSR